MHPMEVPKPKKYKLIIFNTVVLVIALSIVLIYRLQAFEDKKCQFKLSEIIENRFQEDKAAVKGTGHFWDSSPAVHMTYWEIDSILENRAKKRQYLNSIILKIYTNDDKKILLTESFDDVKKWIEPGQSYPFQIRARFNRADPVLSKYFKKDDKIKIDMYPYFNSCNY